MRSKKLGALERVSGAHWDAANAVRLQLHALAYNLGNFLRTLATPEPIKDWSLTSLKEKLIKIGAKVVSRGRDGRSVSKCQGKCHSVSAADSAIDCRPPPSSLPAPGAADLTIAARSLHRRRPLQRSPRSRSPRTAIRKKESATAASRRRLRLGQMAARPSHARA